MDRSVATPVVTQQLHWSCAIAAAALLATQITVLHAFGQPFAAASGRILLWVNDPFSPDTSQQLADWYTFSHIIHGFIFYGVLKVLAPRMPLVARFLIAMGVEIAWGSRKIRPWSFSTIASRRLLLAMRATAS